MRRTLEGNSRSKLDPTRHNPQAIGKFSGSAGVIDHNVGGTPTEEMGAPLKMASASPPPPEKSFGLGRLEDDRPHVLTSNRTQ